MRRWILVPLIIAMLGAFGVVFAARGQADDIVIVGADEVSELGMVRSTTLDAVISSILPRFVLESADANQEYAMAPAPEGLRAQIALVADRMVMEAADGNLLYEFSQIPNPLQMKIRQVADRIRMEAADSNRFFVLQYPHALVDDTTAPTLIDIAVRTTGIDSVSVSWQTDEYADSRVEWGVESGVYGKSASDGLYMMDHELVLTGLSEGVTYYCVVISRDQSGNTRQSAELTFDLESTFYTYLPAIER